MEEPKKVLRAQYLGCTQVNNATGMEVLNDAIDRLESGVTPDKWQPVNISIAPSMISVHHPTVRFYIDNSACYLLSILNREHTGGI